ncbi:unnamed protein product [Rhizoctonia solani]|uniref:Zn(2)-C6 fungal-type domain-containing protein n=1 Tax=Rhizoctonia solani TaxID=456999 RepID=A0A8H2WKS8_9AGAM|nr:unnamed protein product [Rhizoctonia solani]
MCAKRSSGPYPLSCITCRERRKKCDRTHPACNRCKIGGFKCLGYVIRNEDNTYGLNTLPQFDTSIQEVPGLEQDSNQSDTSRPTAQSVPTTAWPLQSMLGASSQRHPSERLQAETPLARGLHNVPYDTYPTTNISMDGPGGLGSSQRRASENPISRDNSLFQIQSSQSLSGVHSSMNSTSPSYWPHMGYTIYRDFDTSVVVTEFIAAQYIHAYSLMAFEFTSHEGSFVQSCVITTITISQSVCWSLFVGAKVYQAAILGHSGKGIERHNQTLDRLDQQISNINWKDMLVQELSGWLLAVLELVDLRFLINSPLAYGTLHLAVPFFVKITQTEPDIWRNIRSGPSLHKVLLSTRAGLSRFATMDIMESFIFGRPQRILWDPVLIPELAHLPWDEWLPGCPLYLMLVICRINIWRKQNIDTCTRNLNEWAQCEREVLNWCPRHSYGFNPTDPWRIIGRLAIIEAFRHMTLLYLYMAVGNLKSHDPLVQASCSQVSQLCGLVEASPSLAVHLFFPAIIVSHLGGFSSNELKQRVLGWCMR